MKKLLAIALLIAMLLTMGMFVTSCDNDDNGPADVSETYEDPYEPAE